MNTAILTAIYKLGRLGSLILVWQPEKENSEFKPVKVHFKNFQLVSLPVRAHGLCIYIYIYTL